MTARRPSCGCLWCLSECGGWGGRPTSLPPAPGTPLGRAGMRGTRRNRPSSSSPPPPPPQGCSLRPSGGVREGYGVEYGGASDDSERVGRAGADAEHHNDLLLEHTGVVGLLAAAALRCRHCPPAARSCPPPPPTAIVPPLP